MVKYYRSGAMEACATKGSFPPLRVHSEIELLRLMILSDGRRDLIIPRHYRCIAHIPFSIPYMAF